METTVYIDLYFIIKFAMDFLCFVLCARLLSIKESFFRTLAASLIGALYACVSLIALPDGAFGVVCDIFACILICTVAFFDRREKSRVLYCTLVYAAVSIVLGGAMSALFVFFNRIGLDRLLGSEEDADGISVWLFALLAFLSGIGAMCGGSVFKKTLGEEILHAEADIWRQKHASACAVRQRKSSSRADKRKALHYCRA